VIPFRQDVANARDATTNADRAPDLERDLFRKPLLDMRRARNNPINVRAMSVVTGIPADIADIIGDAWRRGVCRMLALVAKEICFRMRCSE